MKLGQVILFVKDMARMRAFYGDVVGLVPLAEASSDGWMRFDAGGCRLALHAIPVEIARGITIADPAVAREETAIKFAFSVEDVDAERRRLEAGGARMLEAHRWGEVTLCDGVDPEGNVFQISNRT